MLATQGQFSDFIETVFGKGVPSNGGKNISVICPICRSNHDESYSKKKLVIRTDNGINHCWVCGFKSKNLVFLIKTFYTSHYKEYLEKFVDVSNLLSNVDEDATEYVAPLILPEESKLIVENYKTNYYAKRYFEYLKTRNISSEEDLWYWKFLYTSKDKAYWNRIIVPSFDANGKLNYYTGRRIKENIFTKYKNPYVVRESIIFNEINVNWNEPLVIVEGVFDLIKCTRNATAILGSDLNINYSLFQNIVVNETPVVLALDPDVKEKSIKLAKSLLDYNIDVYMIDIPYDKDVGDLHKEQFLELYNKKQKITKQDLLVHKIRNISQVKNKNKWSVNGKNSSYK